MGVARMRKTKSCRGKTFGRNVLKGHPGKNVALAAAVMAVLGMRTVAAHAAESLWISAPDWSYSAAYAATQTTFGYYWALSLGSTSYSWAGANAIDANGSAYAFAEASADDLGGMGAVYASGIADPSSGAGLNLAPPNPADLGSFPSSPGSDPFFSTPYTPTTDGVEFTSESSSQTNGADGLQAFLYKGGTDQASLDTLLGLSGTSGTSSSGDVSDIATLEGNGSLTPLDPVMLNPETGKPITFNELLDAQQQSEVFLAGFQSAASAPVPSALALTMLGLLGLGGLALARRKYLRRSELY